MPRRNRLARRPAMASAACCTACWTLPDGLLRGGLRGVWVLCVLGGPWGRADEQPDGGPSGPAASSAPTIAGPESSPTAESVPGRPPGRPNPAARGDREAEGGGDVGLEVGVVLRIGRRRARGQRRQPGPVHRDRHRAGHVDHHGARIADRGPPHLPGRGGHRPRFRPPAHQRRQRREGQQRGPPVPPDQGGKGQLLGRPVVASVIVGITGRTRPRSPRSPGRPGARSPRRPGGPGRPAVSAGLASTRGTSRREPASAVSTACSDSWPAP